MCCFSGSIPVQVSATNMFAGTLDHGRQTLAYSMSLTVGEPVAMVLPLPVAPGSGANAVAFIDLSSCAKMFEELAQMFVVPAAGRSRGLAAASITVHRVGSFVASYVPTRADFAHGRQRGQDQVAPMKLANSYMGIAKLDQPVVRRTLNGTHANADIWIAAA